MGQAGSFASFPITFFWISAKTLWMSTDLQREVPLELRELVCDWLQGILHGLTDHISTWYHLLFGSYWFYSKDYTLGYYQLVSAADQGSRMLHLLKFFFCPCLIRPHSVLAWSALELNDSLKDLSICPGNWAENNSTHWNFHGKLVHKGGSFDLRAEGWLCLGNLCTLSISKTRVIELEAHIHWIL